MSTSAALVRSADVLIRKDDHWYAFDTLVGNVCAALDDAVEQTTPDKPLSSRIIAIVGSNAVAGGIARELNRQHCSLILVGGEPCAALARELSCRHCRVEAIYSTNHDVLIVCNEHKDREADGRPAEPNVHPGYLRSGMIVAEVRSALHRSSLVRAAEARGCTVISPYHLWLRQMAQQIRRLTTKSVPEKTFADAVPWMRDQE
jgi:shikimate 5-dehydrogenase